ncbi:MAG: hypothetical protein ACK56I_20445, partial [bacterium]
HGTPRDQIDSHANGPGLQLLSPILANPVREHFQGRNVTAQQGESEQHRPGQPHIGPHSGSVGPRSLDLCQLEIEGVHGGVNIGAERNQAADDGHPSHVGRPRLFRQHSNPRGESATSGQGFGHERENAHPHQRLHLGIRDHRQNAQDRHDQHWKPQAAKDQVNNRHD